MQAHNQVCNEGVIRINYFIVYSFLMASTENSECIAYTLHACIHWGDRAGSRASHKVDTFWLCWSRKLWTDAHDVRLNVQTFKLTLHFHSYDMNFGTMDGWIGAATSICGFFRNDIVWSNLFYGT